MSYVYQKMFKQTIYSTNKKTNAYVRSSWYINADKI